MTKNPKRACNCCTVNTWARRILSTYELVLPKERDHEGQFPRVAPTSACVGAYKALPFSEKGIKCEKFIKKFEE